MRNAEYFRSRIAALEQDIAQFGPAGDDLQRLADYKQDLADIEARVAAAKETNHE